MHASSRADKLWPEAHWRALIAHFTQAGLAVLLPWGTSEEAERSAGSPMASPGAAVGARRELPEIAALLARAEIVCGVDTGLVHLAAALGAPTVALFVATDPALAGVARAGPHCRDLGGTGIVPVPAEVIAAVGASDCARCRTADGASRARCTRLPAATLLPLLPLRLWWRGRREPGYRHAWGERFGRYVPSRRRRRSGGCMRCRSAKRGLRCRCSQHLRRAYPEVAIVLTHMTATGRDTGRALYGDTVMQAWLPYDLPFAVDAFLAHFRPAAGFLLETELWPNLIAHAAARNIPVYLVNARLSERSAAGYRRFASLTRPMLARLARRRRAVGRRRGATGCAGRAQTVVTGNLKFDITVPEAARALGAEFALRFGPSRRVWIAASTREGEEALLLDALERKPLPKDTLLVIVPRHPQRFAAVADLLRERGVPFMRRSDNGRGARRRRASSSATRWESSSAYYAAADLAFVGGSLLPLGGQNLIEPLAARHSGADRTAHLQFRRSECRRSRGRSSRSRRRCGRAGRGRGGHSVGPRAPRDDGRGGARIPRGAPRRRPIGSGTGWRRSSRRPNAAPNRSGRG